MTRRPLLAVLVALAAAGCAPHLPGSVDTTVPSSTAPAAESPAAPATEVPPSLVYPAPTTQATEPPVAGPPVPAPVDARAELARLAIDDQPNGTGYDRTLFMPGGKWQDPDHNGCDARKDALRAQAAPPVTAPGCSTAGGRWPLVYVQGVTTNPSDVDVDHVVPLANAWRSGARNWLPDRRIAYAADPAVLWVVDDGANQSKGDKGPEAWRPKEHNVWCTYARRWTSIKVTYGLTATTPERDALGQMLGEC
jgi:hypothetical protein